MLTLVLWLQQIEPPNTHWFTSDGRRGIEATSVTPGWTPSKIWVRGFGTQTSVIQTIKWVRVDTSTGAAKSWGAFV